MMITTIVGPPRVNDLTSINVFVGDNNAGKSSVIKKARAVSMLGYHTRIAYATVEQEEQGANTAIEFVSIVIPDCQKIIHDGSGKPFAMTSTGKQRLTSTAKKVCMIGLSLGLKGGNGVSLRLDDCGLHHLRYPKLFYNIHRKMTRQLFIETQSLDVLRGLAAAIAQGYVPPQDVSVYRVISGIDEAIRLDGSEFVKAIDSNLEIR